MRLADRLAALSGLAGSVVIPLAISLADPLATGLDPDPTDPAQLIARALQANRARARIGAQVGLLGAFLMLVFASYLYGHLRRAGASGWSAPLVLAGGVLLVTLLVIESGFVYAGSELAAYRGDEQVAKVLFIWGWNSASLVAPGMAAILLGSAVAGFKYGAIPRWLAWLGVVLLVLLVVASLVLSAPGLGAGVGSIWTVLASVALAFGRGTPPQKGEPSTG